MHQRIALGLAMLAGAAIGATAVSGLRAQGITPGAYAVVDISEITDLDVFKTLLPKAPAAMTAFGGHFVTRTEKITGLDGVPPKRFIIIAFDSIEKAKAWNNSAPQAEVNAIRMRSTKSRSFIVAAEGM